MRVLLLIVLLAAALAPAGPLTVANAQDVESVASKARPSVALLIVDRPDGWASGTAFMVARQRLLTAAHVVEHAQRIRVILKDYPETDALIVSQDPDRDLALLSVPWENGPRDLRGFPPLPIGDVAEVRQGETVVVIGFPRIDVLGATTPTVTVGIVSAIRRWLPGDPNAGFLQIQAPVSPGNSGGPVLNLKGQVIGVVLKALRDAQLINLAATIDVAQPLWAGSK